MICPLTRKHRTRSTWGSGTPPKQRAATYRRSFRLELDPVELHEIRSAANGGFALGNDKFKAEIATVLGRRVERQRKRNSKFSS